MTDVSCEVYATFRAIGVSEGQALAVAAAITSAVSPGPEARPSLHRLHAKLNLVLGIVIGAALLVGVPTLWLLCRIAAKLGA